jgi:hypothetical protein
VQHGNYNNQSNAGFVCLVFIVFIWKAMTTIIVK